MVLKTVVAVKNISPSGKLLHIFESPLVTKFGMESFHTQRAKWKFKLPLLPAAAPPITMLGGNCCPVSDTTPFANRRFQNGAF